MKSRWRLGLTLLTSCALIGCSARYPAPVLGLTKDYSSIGRGSYRGSFYEVQKGDTLYKIAFISNKDVNELIEFNDLQKPYIIHPGQRLRLWQPRHRTPIYGKAAPAATAVKPASSSSSAVSVAPPVVASPPKVTPKISHKKTVTAHKSSPKVKNVKKVSQKKVESSHSSRYVSSKGKQNVNVVKKTSSNAKVSKWIWPVKGRVIKGFSSGDQGNKGIDIAGQRGQSIVSTAKGSVVYSGNALKGYGNLIIIKHNDHYLSAYAHNERLLVKEGQTIKAGQKIATMGSSGTSSVRLHFEIRYQGKSVNPKRYLP